MSFDLIDRKFGHKPKAAHGKTIRVRLPIDFVQTRNFVDGAEGVARERERLERLLADLPDANTTDPAQTRPQTES